MSAHTSDRSGQSRLRASFGKARSRLRTTSTRLNGAAVRHWLEDRRRYAPTLVLATLCWLLVAYILTTVPPARIAHIPLANSYAPLMIPTLLGLFLLSSIVFLNRRRAYLVTLWFGSLFFLKLQQIALSLNIIAVITGVVLAFELVRVVVKKTRSV